MLSILLSSLLAASVFGQAPSATITPVPAVAPAPTGSPLPLTDYKYKYEDLPYKVNPFFVGRGPQTGYNICNSTTAGADSQCQTLIFNSIDDFCLWGSPVPGAVMGDSEALVVAFCTKNTHGARTIPAGAISAVQFMRTEAYIQVVGRIDQTKLNLRSDDYGGELDPHGADLLGNPLGGLVYSNGVLAANSSSTSPYTQVISWNNFVGANLFCLKICNPNYNSGSTNYCQNVYDLIGCSYNMPSSLYNNATDSFTECEGELQDEVGFYTGSNGVTSKWLQPRDTAISTLPYQPRIPASSNCRTFQSTQLFAVATPTQSSNPSSMMTGTVSPRSGASSGLSGSSGAATRTGGSSSGSTPTSTQRSGAGILSISTISLPLFAVACYILI